MKERTREPPAVSSYGLSTSIARSREKKERQRERGEREREGEKEREEEMAREERNIHIHTQTTKELSAILFYLSRLPLDRIHRFLTLVLSPHTVRGLLYLQRQKRVGREAVRERAQIIAYDCYKQSMSTKDYCMAHARFGTLQPQQTLGIRVPLRYMRICELSQVLLVQKYQLICCMKNIFLIYYLDL